MSSQPFSLPLSVLLPAGEHTPPQSVSQKVSSKAHRPDHGLFPALLLHKTSLPGPLPLSPACQKSLSWDSSPWPALSRLSTFLLCPLRKAEGLETAGVSARQNSLNVPASSPILCWSFPSRRWKILHIQQLSPSSHRDQIQSIPAPSQISKYPINAQAPCIKWRFK